MFCTKCGVNLTSDAKFCAGCGTKVVGGSSESMPAAMEASRVPTAQGTLVGAFANHRQSLTGRQIAGALFGVIGLGAIGATFLSAHKELIAGDPTKDAAVQFVQKGLRSPDSFSLVSYREFWSGNAADGKNAHVSRVVFNAQNGFGATIRGCQLLAFKLQGDQMTWDPITGVRDCSEWPAEEKLDPELLALIQ